MGKQIIITFLAIFLLVPQSSLMADSKHKYRYHNSPKHKGFPHRTRVQLKSLKIAIVEIEKKLEELKSQIDDIPSELSTKLTALQLVVDNNSSDISLALTDIVDILQVISEVTRTQGDHTSRIGLLESNVADVSTSLGMLSSTVDDLELRVLALEQSNPPPTSGVIFSGTFTQSTVADAGLQQAWEDFRNNATGSFDSIEIKNSLNGSVTCADPAVATQIANQLNVHLLGQASTSFTCESQIWNVGTCDSGIELNAGSDASVCVCSQNAAVRPRIGNNNFNWGGVGTNFGGSGGTCGAPTQTLEVILTR